MSRIYANCKEAINEIERDIHEMGIKVHPHSMQNKEVKNNPNYETKELQNYSFTILDTKDKDDITNCLEWCKAEFAERIAENFINPGEAWKLRENIWKEFLNEEDMFDYTYNERINICNQLKRVIKELTDNSDSRQCIIEIHQPSDIYNLRSNRMPCSLSYQLMIRRDKLDIIYNMRSCDFATHFKNDIWLAIELRNYIARKLFIKPGLFQMNIGSLHIYRGYGGNKHVF